jgi:hypothetical protein
MLNSAWWFSPIEDELAQRLVLENEPRIAWRNASPRRRSSLLKAYLAALSIPRPLSVLFSPFAGSDELGTPGLPCRDLLERFGFPLPLLCRRTDIEMAVKLLLKSAGIRLSSRL